MDNIFSSLDLYFYGCFKQSPFCKFETLVKHPKFCKNTVRKTSILSLSNFKLVYNIVQKSIMSW